MRPLLIDILECPCPSIACVPFLARHLTEIWLWSASTSEEVAELPYIVVVYKSFARAFLNFVGVRPCAETTGFQPNFSFVTAKMVMKASISSSRIALA